MKKFYLFITIIIVAAGKISAQNSMRPNLCFQDMNFYNPASIPMDTSCNYYLSLSGEYKFVKDEAEIWNEKLPFYLNHIGRIKQTGFSYSVMYLYDRYSFFSRNGLSLGVAYQIKWGAGHVLSLGGRAVFNFDIANWDRLRIPVSMTGKKCLLNPDLDLGIEYKIKGLVLGLASRNIFAYGAPKAMGLIQNRRVASLHASYLFSAGKQCKIAPLLFLYLDRKIIYDIGIYTSIYERVRLSYVMRINELRNIFTTDVRIVGNLYLGAAFDFSLVLPDKNLNIVLKYAF